MRVTAEWVKLFADGGKKVDVNELNDWTGFTFEDHVPVKQLDEKRENILEKVKTPESIKPELDTE